MVGRPGAATRLALADDLIAKFDPNEPRDSRGRWTTAGVTAPAKPAVSTLPAEAQNSSPSEGEVSPDSLTPAAYNGFYHDWVVADEAAYLRSKGETVETEVRLAMADGSASARIDILAFDPQTKLVYGLEVKTGDRPGFTAGQIVVYPHVMMGGSVVALDGRVAVLGLMPGIPLQNIPIYLMTNKDMFSKRIYNELDPNKMSRYYRGEEFYSKRKMKR